MLYAVRYPARALQPGRASSSLGDVRRPKILSFLATCAPGLEAVVAAELQAPAIRAANVAVAECGGGVFFAGTWVVAFNAVLWLRCGSRVLHLIASANLPWVDASAMDPIYQFIKYAVQWERFLMINDNTNTSFRSFSIDCNVRNCTRKSVSLYAPRKAVAAINDALDLEFDPDDELDQDQLRKNKPTEVPLFLLVHKDKARLYRDMTRELDTRGYREIIDKTSLPGGLAAGILTLAGWNSLVPGFGEINRNSPTVLLDPMCGHGTLLIEAALMSSNTAPGLLQRGFPFMNWHDFDEEAWEDCRARASAAAIEPPSGVKFLGNDRNAGVVAACSRAAEIAGVDHLLDLSVRSCENYEPPLRPSLVVVDPPQESKERTESLFPTYLELGRFLRKQCRQSDAYVLDRNRHLAGQLWLKPDVKWPLTIQGLGFQLCHYYVLPERPPKETPPRVAASSSASP